MWMVINLDAAFARYTGDLGAVAGKIPRLTSDALNEAGDKVRTIVRRSLREQTGVRLAGSITKRTSSKRAGPGHLVYEIHGTGSGMPIAEFPVKAGKGGPVVASPWGRSRAFKRSFKSPARGLLRARLGAGRLPIRSLRGPAVSKEIVKGETLATFDAQAAPMVEQMVVKRLGRLFG